MPNRLLHPFDAMYDYSTHWYMTGEETAPLWFRAYFRLVRRFYRG